MPRAEIAVGVVEPADREAVIGLWDRCGLTVSWNNPEKDILRKATNSPDLFFAARDGQRIVGSCMAGYDGHRGWIYYLAVHPDYQKKGVARKMIRHAEDALEKYGCPKVNLMVRDSNTAAQAFYRKLGYRPDAVTVMGRRLEDDETPR
jgi:ribosomal protein S18 acetylase RimI-like enzyme